MKKILALVLSVVMMLSFAACGSTPEEVPAVQLEGTLEEISGKIIENTTTIEMMLGEAMAIDLADVDASTYYFGVDPTGKIENAVFTEPMIGSIPFSMCIIEGAEGAKIEDLKNEILEGVNYRKWVCVAAEKVLVSSCGNKILMIISNIIFLF